MGALTVLLIRHAEKPLKAWPGPGLSQEGVADGKSLVIRGWQRAGAWAVLFGTGSQDYPVPAAIYAAKPEEDIGRDPCRRPYETIIRLAERLGIVAVRDVAKGEEAAPPDPSRRPYETIIPLAERLGIVPVLYFAKGNEVALATHIQTLTGVVLVCWEHKAIMKALLPALLGPHPIAGISQKWDDTRFDVVLRLDREEGGSWTLRQQFPRLLSGDSNIPL